MTDLSALIARVEEGTRPDRDLDLDVLVAFGWRDERDYGFMADPKGEHYWINNPDCWNGEPPFPTSSLDAVLSLIEQKLPGWVVSTIGQSDDRSWWAELRRGHQTSYDKVALSNLKCASAPRAALAATLRAIQSKEGPSHDA